MDYQIIKMNDNTLRIEDHGVRFFLLAGREKALLIDSGMQVHNAKEIAESLTSLPIFLLNTHADMDHIGSNAEFAECYMHPKEMVNYHVNNTVIPVNEGDILDLGDRPLQIIHLPGHTAGSIAVLDSNSRVLISGDPVQQNGRIFMFGSHRNMNDYIRSLAKLNQMTDRFDELWPSHGDIPVRPELIGQLLEGSKKVINREIPGTVESFHGHTITAYDLGFTVLLSDH